MEIIKKLEVKLCFNLSIAISRVDNILANYNKSIIMRKVLFIILFVLPLSILAQKNIAQTENPLFKKATELFSKSKYGTASIYFSNYIRDNHDVNSSEYIASKYYKSYCDMKMKRPNAKKQMETFIKDYPYTVYASRGKKMIAYSSFSSEDYTYSLDYFENIDENSFKGDEKAEFLLKRAYCYMVNNQTKKAANDFYSIDSSNEKYKPVADFYYANIAFREGNYQTAFELLDKLKDNDEFASVVPYYVIQVYYMQQKFDEIIEMSSDYYDRIKGDRKYILSRILANAYFNKEDYEMAKKYYSIYFGYLNEVEKLDNYEYGYCLYKLGEYEEAIAVLEKVGGKDDLIIQATSFCLSDCYLRIDNKEMARKAISIAASLDFDPEIKEMALFNKAKMNYELSYSPFNETLNSFDEYISLYPDSRRNDEAYDYLVKVYMQTKDYSASLNSMDKIEVKTVSLKKAHQRISYYRAIELFNSDDFIKAIEMFNNSLTHGIFNTVIAADCTFWLAESYYKLGDYKKAIDLFDSFLLTPGASLTDNYARAYYALAYSYYQVQNYSKAIDYFKSFELQEKDESSMYLADARCRIVDYYLFERNYQNCISYCDKLIENKSSSADYAYFNKALAYGLLGDNKNKLRSLDKMLSVYPSSDYYSEACYKAGNAAMSIEDNAMAKEYFSKIIQQNKSFEYDAKSKLQLALIAYNEKDLLEAKKVYKSVIADYLGTDYAVAAKSGLKNVMVEINDVDNYYAYIKDKGMQTDKDDLAKDSLVFAAAEKMYMEENLKGAIPALGKYINGNEDGDFLLTANYYLADSYYRETQESNALPFYEKVLEVDDNTYTLDAALHAAEINNRSKVYAKSLSQFAIVERLSTNDKDKFYAQWKIFEGNYLLENYTLCIQEGESLLSSSYNIESVRYDINSLLANSYSKTDDLVNAMKYYSLLAKNMNTKVGAEAKYLICKSLYEGKDYSQAEKEINEFMESESTQYFYLAKSFMLLADIFLNKNDKFQAKYTLLSIVDNYPTTDDGILDEAKRRIDLLKDKQEVKEDSIKQNNAAKKTKIENEDLERYRQKIQSSEKEKSKKEKAENILNGMNNTDVE
jgi:tetratricopeptide (TPR) repeat protein